MCIRDSVHDAPGAERAERVNRLLAPAAVYAHRQGMVQLVVSGGDVEMCIRDRV